MKHRLFPILFYFAGAFLFSGCLFGGDGDSDTFALRPGIYRGDYGAEGRAEGHESEMILGEDGGFRFFEIKDTTAWSVVRADWKFRDGTLILESAVRRDAHWSGIFDVWKSLAPDTSYLRDLSENTFERLEVSRDTGYFSYLPVPRWTRYRRQEPLPPLADGRYEISETYPDPDDSATLHSARFYLSLTRGGLYRDSTGLDGVPLWQNEARRWFQAGSFLIVRDGRGRDYDTAGFTEWGGWFPDSNAEYVVRVRAVTPDSFQQWMAEDQTFSGTPHWATWRRTPAAP